jgi:molybdate transport system ATP-binding protein
MVVDHFSLDLGQHWCLFGGNGSGKTLLAELLCGKRVDSGSYVSYADGFDPGKDIHIVSFEEQQRLWQRDNRLDISEYADNAQDQGTLVEQLIRASRSTNKQDEALLSSLAVELALEEFLHKGIRFLSSGQIRRVLIARALYARRDDVPQLIVFDDPLESIDRFSCQKMEDCIQRYLGESNCSLQLCRREQDILPSATHLALIQRSEKKIFLSQQGPIQSLRESDDFADFRHLPPVGPDTLPGIATPDTSEQLGDEALIRLENVSANYGSQAVLKNINWIMKSGDHVLIEGPNGCGKSTLLSLIDGENHKAYGQGVSLFGKLRGSGETVWEIKSRFGVVSNELHNKYVKGWRVLDVVVSGFFDSVGLYDDSGGSEHHLAQQWLKTLGIENIHENYYHEISFGQQRLVLLARAMVKSPSILILDEPCVGLDDYHRSLILSTLELIAEQTKTQLIYVSHVEDEKPGCITQKLEFVAGESGGFMLIQTELSNEQANKLSNEMPTD